MYQLWKVGFPFLHQNVGGAERGGGGQVRGDVRTDITGGRERRV